MKCLLPVGLREQTKLSKNSGVAGRNRTDALTGLQSVALPSWLQPHLGTRRGIPTPIHFVLSEAALAVGVHGQNKNPTRLEWVRNFLKYLVNVYHLISRTREPTLSDESRYKHELDKVFTRRTVSKSQYRVNH